MTPSLFDAERDATNDPDCRAVAFGDADHRCTTRAGTPIAVGERCWRIVESAR